MTIQKSLEEIYSQKVNFDNRRTREGGVNIKSIYVFFHVDQIEGLIAPVESVALKESRVLHINSAQGQLSLVTLNPQGPSSASPLFYEGRWEILSLTGVFVPNNSVGMNHPMGGMTIRFREGAGEAIQGGIGGFVIVDTAVVVFMTTYNLHGEEKRKRQHRAGPRAARPNPST